MRYLQSFSTSGAVQEALDYGLLGQPYVALVDGSGLDWNTLTPVPPVPPAETRMKVTYHVDAPGEILLIRDDAVGDSSLVSVEVNGTVIGLGENWDPEMEHAIYTASTSGDIVAYFTFSGNTIGADDEYSSELFYWDSYSELPGIPIVAIEIPDNLVNICHNALAYVGGDESSILSAVTIPDVPMYFGKEAFRGNKMLQVVKTASMSGTGYVYIPSGSTLDRNAFSECGRYMDEQTYETHDLLTAATFGAGVNFVDNYWEDEGDEHPMGYQFEETPIRHSTFLGTVPPTIQMNTLYWAQEWDGNLSYAQVPTGYESDYVDSFNNQLHDDEQEGSWYFGLGLPSDEEGVDCETGPTPGYIWADTCGGDAECKCRMDWGAWDYDNEVCHECGWEPDPCDDWAGAGYSSYEECNCSEHGEDCEEGE